jgi:hypothetical protein
VENDDDALVPTAYQEAAEEVRAHLVAVRGGAPFLSPADARLLVSWLDAGVPVVDVLRAIERAAEARRKARSRLPLTLTRVKVHLGKPHPAKHVARATEDHGHPLAVIAAQLRDRGAEDLAGALLALPTEDPDALVRAALAHARAWMLRAWEALPPDRRDAMLDEARETLRSLQLGHTATELETMAEEVARDELRHSWPMLDASTLWDAVHGGSA